VALTDRNRKLTQQQTQEILKCGKDPIYFINKYCKIRHPVRGVIPFKTYPFQDDCVRAYTTHRKNIVLKSRQLGLSTISAAYSLWYALFKKDKTILVIATKLSTANNFVKKVKLMLKYLPQWLLLCGFTPHAGDVMFTNGSSITAISASADAGRSEALSLLIVDEAAWIDKFEDIWTGLEPTVSEGGDVIVLSTPNGMSGKGGQYYRIWRDGEANVNDFNTIKLPWDVHPEHDQTWYDKETKGKSRRTKSQEYECDFLFSGDTFLEPEELAWVRENIAQPIEKLSVLNSTERCLWVWKHPEQNKKYVLGGDVARGNAKDFSTFHIIDSETLEVCAEYMGKIPPERFGMVINEWGLKYNKALVVIEGNSYGYSTNTMLRSLEYPRLYYEKHKKTQVPDPWTYEPEDDETPGFDTNGKSRLPMLTKLSDAIRTHALKTKSQRLYDQLQTFVYIGNKPQAGKDSWDDLVMSIAIGCWLLECSDKQNEGAGAFARAMMNATKVVRRGTECLPYINEVQPLMNPMMLARSAFAPQDPTQVAKQVRGRRSELSNFSWLL